MLIGEEVASMKFYWLYDLPSVDRGRISVGPDALVGVYQQMMAR
jgi:hypothetical protein